MATDAVTCPLTQRQLIDEYFMEHRTKVLDIAAFLDRLDRAAVPMPRTISGCVAFREALRELHVGTTPAA